MKGRFPAGAGPSLSNKCGSQSRLESAESVSESGAKQHSISLGEWASYADVGKPGPSAEIRLIDNGDRARREGMENGLHHAAFCGLGCDNALLAYRKIDSSGLRQLVTV